MKDEVSKHSHHGWWNRCIPCELNRQPSRYWVRAADITKFTVTRYTDDTCKERHECQLVAPA